MSNYGYKKKKSVPVIFETPCILWTEDGPVQGPKHAVSLIIKKTKYRQLCFDLLNFLPSFTRKCAWMHSDVQIRTKRELQLLWMCEPSIDLYLRTGWRRSLNILCKKKKVSWGKNRSLFAWGEIIGIYTKFSEINPQSLVSAKTRRAKNRHVGLLRHQRKLSVPGYCHVTNFIPFKSVNVGIMIWTSIHVSAQSKA